MTPSINRLGLLLNEPVPVTPTGTICEKAAGTSNNDARAMSVVFIILENSERFPLQDWQLWDIETHPRFDSDVQETVCKRLAFQGNPSANSKSLV
jgi:hypothetical protein